MLETSFPFFISKTRGEIPIFGTLIREKKINFGLYFAENRHFQVGHDLLRHCDVIHGPIFMTLVSLEGGDPIRYYGTKQLYFERVNFKFTEVVTTPPQTCYKKGSGRQGLNSSPELLQLKKFKILNGENLYTWYWY